MAIIPSNRLTTWTGNVGVPPSIAAAFPGTAVYPGTQIPNRSTVFRTLTPSGGDDTSAINSAIASCPQNQVVLLSAGTFTINGSITFNIGVNNVTLRGAGNSTILKHNSNNFLINFGTGGGTLSPHVNSYVNPVAWTAGYAQGTSVITVASTTGYSVGQVIVLNQNDDPALIWTDNAVDNTWFTSGGTSGTPTQSLMETKRITAISGNQITLDTPIVWTQFDTKWNPTMYNWGDPTFQAVGNGLESFYIDSSNASFSAAYDIFMIQNYGCWIKDVYDYFGYGYHCLVANAARCEFRRMTFWDAKLHAENCGAFLFDQGCTSCLVEDCIFYRQCPAVECDYGCLGNAFLYNFEMDTYEGVLGNNPVLNGAFYANHGAQGAMVLYEGNYGESFYNDGYHGGGSHFTCLRNRFHGHNTAIPGHNNSMCINCSRWSLFCNLVGNILGCSDVANVYSETTNGYSGDNFFPILKVGYPEVGNSAFGGAGTPSNYRPSTTYVQDYGAGGNASMQCWDYATRPNNEWGKDGVTVFTATAGYQQGTMILEGNFDTIHNAVVWNSIASTAIPQSFYYSSKPAYFNSLAWPPFDPATPGNLLSSNVPLGGSAIPAGYRFNNGGADPPPGGLTTINATVIIK